MITVEKLVYLLPALGCAAMMGAMMWMMRGHHASNDNSNHNGTTNRPDLAMQTEIAALRAEIATLRAAQSDTAADTAADTAPGTPADGRARTGP